MVFRENLINKIGATIESLSLSCGDKDAIALVSGGKDSSLALYLAVEAGINIKRIINFTHNWTWNLYRSQIDDLGERFGIPIDYIDLTETIRKPISEGGLVGYVGIPCKYCKPLLFDHAQNAAKELGCNSIISGYNAMDSVSNMILQNLANSNGEGVSPEFNQFSKYLSDPDLFELRPLIQFTDEEILEGLDMAKIKVQRTHEANPQFEYWREGCPMQYIDRDVPITVDLLDRSKEVNERLAKFARDNNFRASVLVPSMELIVIPESKVNLCREFLGF